MVQQFCVSTAVGAGSIPGQGTKMPLAAQCNQKVKKKKKKKSELLLIKLVERICSSGTVKSLKL